jgi:predicted SAM-dependent methyltransferase
MTGSALFANWDWEDTDGLVATFDEFTSDLARCETLELIARPVPVTGQDFLDIGLTGIEFATFKTRHPSGLGTDLVGLHTAAMTTEPGRLYRADGTSYFAQLDISKELPFDDNCVAWVYAEHLIEHVPPPVALRWLSEVRRILVPGGLLRITTPDLRKFAQSYVTGDSFFARQRRRLSTMRVGPPMPERPAFMLNQLFYLYGHRWLYDLDELRYALARAGFESPVQARAFGEGARADVAALDRVFRRLETIYIETTA